MARKKETATPAVENAKKIDRNLYSNIIELDKALNVDLWEPLLSEISKHNVTYTWVKGHAGHPENERCDFLATEAILGDNLLEDIQSE